MKLRFCPEKNSPKVIFSDYMNEMNLKNNTQN